MKQVKISNILKQNLPGVFMVIIILNLHLGFYTVTPSQDNPGATHLILRGWGDPIFNSDQRFCSSFRITQPSQCEEVSKAFRNPAILTFPFSNFMHELSKPKPTDHAGETNYLLTTE